MLLLKYPVPDGPHCPQTFVKDAQFLRSAFHYEGGAKLIEKYSGKRPKDPYSSQRPALEPRLPSHLLDKRRSPLPSPVSFLRQQGGMEAILQGAAKNILDRGERLGVNQALRDAAGEVRKNLQGLSPSPSVSRRTSENQVWKIDDRRQPPAAKALVALEARNRKLGELLSEVTDSLYTLSTSPGRKDSDDNESMSVALKQLGLIKDCLNDSKLSLPSFSSFGRSHQRTDSTNRIGTPTVASEDGADEILEDPSSFDLEDYDTSLDSPHKRVLERMDSLREETQRVKNDIQTSLPNINVSNSVGQGDGPSSPTRNEPEPAAERPARPPAIVPTRSTLAQSSFAWMLEPGEEPHSAKPKSLSPSTSTTSPFATGAKTVLRHGRERSSFLFGDEPGIPLDDSGSGSKKDQGSSNGFSLGPMKK